ncbi:MAG TPA: Ig-like domain-containing protein [Steroidobacteraceae bacterium]
MSPRKLLWKAVVAFAPVMLIARCGSNGTAPATPTPSMIALVSGDGQSGTVGKPLPQALVVRVTDKSDAGVAGVAVSWTISAGAGHLSATATQTDAQGRASVTWTLGPAAGSSNNSVQASASGLTGSPVTFRASGLAAAASAIFLVSGNDQSANVGQALPKALAVQVTDSAAVPLAGVTVSWAITAGGGSLSATTTQTDAQGLASVTWMIGAASGLNNDSVQASTAGATGSPVTFTASGLIAATATVYTDTGAFHTATGSLGPPTIVTFDDVDSTPINNTISGRTPFDGTHYAGQGFTFASPGGYALYIAPGGLFWNASNSLSIGHFPFDTTHVAPLNDADSLRVTLNARCSATSLQLVDNGSSSPTEFVAFLDSAGDLVQKAPLPPPYTNHRTFIGIVSSVRIASMLIAEDANDGDDVDYDDFTCFP